MPPMLWGLDLREIHYSKFKSSYMFNNTYHLRRSKMIVYQLGMLLCSISQGVGQAAMTEYVKQKQSYRSLDPLHEYQDKMQYHNDFIAVAACNIGFSLAISIVFGAAFFFDLIWPERKESAAVRWAWKLCAIIVCLVDLADGIMMTLIVAGGAVSMNIQGIPFHALPGPTGSDITIVPSIDIYMPASGYDWLHTPVAVFQLNPKCIAAVALLWLGWVATVASTIIMFLSHRHDEKLGPRSRRAHVQEKPPEVV